MKKQTPFAVISAELDRCSLEQNARRTNTLRMLLTLNHAGFDFKQVVGSYQGIQEASFIVLLPEGNNPSSERWNTLLGLADAMSQESVLFVDAGRGAWLHFMAGPDTFLGKWKAADELEQVQALAGDISHTRTEDGHIYVVA